MAARFDGRRMRLGVLIRTMGPQATTATLSACALAAERAGLDDVWVPDHVAIPPDDAEGSEGRYLDPLAVLAFLAARTSRVGLGTGVLVLPYRPALPTAKAIATVQELSAGRLRLGVGVGWMAAEFRALGVARERRGRISDETLDFLQRCFGADEVESHGQRFLFRPRPARPPIYVGGAPPQAFERTLRYGDGWMPMGGDPEKLAPRISELRERAQAAGREQPEVVLLTSLPLDEPRAAVDRALALAKVGVSQLVVGWRYADAAEFERKVQILAERVGPTLRDAN
jgi:probable F420-dependent oxidoreductase